MFLYLPPPPPPPHTAFLIVSFVFSSSPIVDNSDVQVLADIAQAVQTRLDSYKADKRDLGAVSFDEF